MYKVSFKIVKFENNIKVNLQIEEIILSLMRDSSCDISKHKMLYRFFNVIVFA